MNAFPETIRNPLRSLLNEIGDSGVIQSVRRLDGGCINNAMRLETERLVYLLKWHANPLPGMFEAEARGLALLAATHTVRVPQIFGFQEEFILLEWLEGDGGSESYDQGRLGEQLAALHQAGHATTYGLDHNNYLGSTLQENPKDQRWSHFFGEARLRSQMELARRNHRLPPDRERRLTQLIERLDAILGDIIHQPSLIHGDLWSGNVIPGPGGLALIDPAVSYSDREAEIAFTELFGGFSSRFYAAYQSSWPLQPGYEERRDLYHLYHLLNHLNLFGESYAGAVDSILRRYTQ